MKAVAYARYSSDLQKPSSIGDQQALCRKYSARSGYTIIAEYADAAQSGSDTRDRLGYQALMNDARAGAFDAVIVEAFDRLSRDQEDMARTYKQLSFKRILPLQASTHYRKSPEGCPEPSEFSRLVAGD